MNLGVMHGAGRNRIGIPGFQMLVRLALDNEVGFALQQISHLDTRMGMTSGAAARLEGEADLIIDGKPDLHLKAGDSYAIPAGAVHDARVHGDKPLKVLGVYVVDKTKPLASPAP
jgi:Cupin domain